MRECAAGVSAPPLPTTNLFARYIATQGVTATGGVITQWSDVSGNGNHATAVSGGPLVRADYVGRPIVRFAGAQELILAASHVFSATGVAIFMAGRFYGGTFFGLTGYGGSSGNLRNPGTPNEFLSVSQHLAILPRSNPMLLGVDDTDTDTTGYSNYETNATGAHVTFGLPTGAELGAINNGSFGVMDANEIVIYENGPPPITGIRAYFNAKYGYSGSDYTKNVVFEGDSITAGSGLAEALGYPIQFMRPAVADWRQFVAGVSGSTIATMTARASGTDAWFKSGATRNVLLVLIGRNDVVADVASVVYSNLITYIQARVTAGWEVWSATCIASGVSLQPTLDSLNALIRGTPMGGTGPGIIADAGATKVVDFGAQPHFQTSTDAANTSYYQGDSTHPNATGAGLLAAYAAAQF